MAPLSMEDFFHLEAHVEEIMQDKKDYRNWMKGARLLMRFLQEEQPEWGTQVISRYSVTEDRLIRWASMVLCNNFALNYEKLAAAEQAQGGAVTAEGGDGDHPCKAESSGAPQASHEAQFHIGKVCGGRVLYVSASFFNHSCWPNSAMKTSLAEGQVVAISHIGAGEEICLSYIDTDLPRSERQKRLKQMFFFDCGCPRCVEEQSNKAGQKYSFLKSVPLRDTKPKLRGKKARQKSRY